MTKVAIIGLGTMGQMHAAAWKQIAGAELVAVSGRNAEKTERLAEQFGVKPHYSLEELLNETEFDVLDVCVPTYLHKPFVLQAAAAGKHVICEKPLGLNTQEAQDMIDACAANRVRLFVGHDLRFCPEYQKAHQLVKTGRLGNIAVVRMSRNSAYPAGWNNWFADPNRSGGVLLDLLVHDFDWIRWTFGEVRRVTAKLVSGEAEEGPYEYAAAALRMEDGTIVHAEGSWAHTGFTSKFEITGTNGMLAENMELSSPLSVRLKEVNSSETPGVIVPDLLTAQSPVQRELEHFIRCIEDGSEPLVTAYDALKAVEIAGAAALSAKTGQPVSLHSHEGVKP